MMGPGVGRGGFMPDMSVLGPARSGGGGSRGVPGGGATPPGAQTPSTPLPAGAVAPKPRTEFIVMFFWREPTPSDQLMNLGGAATPGR
jgi:hypothetical protein